MKSLVRHLWDNNRDEIVARSRRNCHAKGLHSVMLLESPGKTIRLFVADWNHDLYNNRLGWSKDKMSVAVHSHHCAVTLACVLGHFFNERAWFIPRGFVALNQFVFDSKLRGGTGGFTPGRAGPHSYQPDSQRVETGDYVLMHARAFHTVSVPREERAAWFVFEGAEDPGYTPVCYSNTDLTQFSAAGLYEQPEEKEIERWLRIAKLL